MGSIAANGAGHESALGAVRKLRKNPGLFFRRTDSTVAIFKDLAFYLAFLCDRFKPLLLTVFLLIK
ncbi:MAG: hypothetical protein ACREJM_04870 [Candidatus Saccharimonadales bacterium]